MKRALWRKAWGEAWVMLTAMVALMLAFHWLYVWITSQLDLKAAQAIIENIPEVIKRLLPVEATALATYEGRLAFAYDHPVVVFGGALWAIARGSDAVSGPLGRGTLELVLAQPVRRTTVLATHAVITLVGTVAMALAGWFGMSVGVQMIRKMQGIDIAPYGWCVLNWICMLFFLTALTTMISAADRNRGRTIGITVAVYVFALLFKVVSRAAPGWEWLRFASFLTAYEPQRLIAAGPDVGPIALRYNLTFVAAGLVCYLIAGVIFAKRDIPPPL